MIVKILGVLDIFAGIIFWLVGTFQIDFLKPAIIVVGLFLLVKGVIFMMKPNVTSGLDIISAIIMIAATGFAMPGIVIIVVSLFLLQKGVISLMS